MIYIYFTIENIIIIISTEKDKLTTGLPSRITRIKKVQQKLAYRTYNAKRLKYKISLT